MRRVVTKWRATIAALLLLAGCGAVGLWFEFVSVPAPLADLILDRVQARSGLVLSAEQIQAGFLRGLVCRNASVEARTEELSFQGRAAELVIRLRPAGLLREGPAVSRVTFIDACATVQASPGDARNTPLLTVEDADGIVDVASGGLIGRRVAARINGIRLDLRGPLPSLASLMPPAPRKGDQPPAAAPWDRRASQLLTRLCQWLPCPSSEPLPDKGTLFVEFRETTPDLAARLGFTSGPGLRIPPMHLSLDLSLDGRDWSAENLRLVLPGRGEFTGHATVAWPGAAGEEARVTIRGGAAPGTFESCLGLTPPDGTPGSTCAFQIEAEQAVADHAAWTIQAGLQSSCGTSGSDLTVEVTAALQGQALVVEHIAVNGIPGSVLEGDGSLSLTSGGGVARLDLDARVRGALDLPAILTERGVAPTTGRRLETLDLTGSVRGRHLLLSPEQWRLELDADLKGHFTDPETELACGLRATAGAREVSLALASCRVDGRAYAVEAGATWNRADQTWNGSLAAALSVEELGSLPWPGKLLPLVQALEAPENTRLDLFATMAPCPLDRAVVGLEARLGPAAWRGLELKEVQAQADLTRTALSGEVTVALADPETGPGGSLLFRLERETGFLNADAQLVCRPDRLVVCLPEQARTIASRFSFPGDPVVIRARTRAADLHAADWRVDLDLDVPLLHYLDLPIRNARGTASVNPELVEIRVPRAEAADNVVAEDVSCRIDLTQEQTFHMTLAGRVRGDPGFAAVFVDDPTAKAIYRSIWDDFRWGPEAEPVVNLHHLTCFNGPEPGDWWVTMAAEMSARGARWREVDADLIQTRVELDLPRQVRIPWLGVAGPEVRLRGEAVFAVQAPASCRFSCDGEAYPPRLLEGMRLDLAKAFAGWELLAPAAVSVTGEIPLAREAAVRDWRLGGEVRTSQVRYLSLPFAAVAGEWSLADATLLMDVDAECNPGTAHWKGSLDLTTGTARGDLQLQGAGVVEPKRMADGVAGTPAWQARTDGRLTGELRVDRVQRATDGHWELNGGGHVKLEQDDLWQLPLLKELADLLQVSLLEKVPGFGNLLGASGLGGLGRISTLSTPVRFAGREAVLEEITTDGTILALKGNGRYNWTTDYMDILIRAVPLQKTRIIPAIWRGVTWAFVDGARCRGSLADHNWTPDSALVRMLPGNEAPGTPPDP